jgi:hypothetical protein
VEADGSTLVRANLTSIKDEHGTHGMKQGVVQSIGQIAPIALLG